MKIRQTLGWLGLCGLAYLFLQVNASASVEPEPYRLLKEPSTHASGKVNMEIFVDFYCPHCHHFEASVLPELRNEFGARLNVTEVGLPVIRNRSRLPFELYEAARAEGKGADMVRVLFRVLQDEKRDIEDPAVQEMIIKEAGVDQDAIKKRLASGEPKRALDEGIARANRNGVSSTPAILLDGYVLTENPTAGNLHALITHLLSGQKL